jgi:hypothetical protein
MRILLPPFKSPEIEIDHRRHWMRWTDHPVPAPEPVGMEAAIFGSYFSGVYGGAGTAGAGISNLLAPFRDV